MSSSNGDLTKLDNPHCYAPKHRSGFKAPTPRGVHAGGSIRNLDSCNYWPIAWLGTITSVAMGVTLSLLFGYIVQLFWNFLEHMNCIDML